MDSSLQSAANLTTEELDKSLVENEGIVENVEGKEEEEHHIHLPNPSLWPLTLSGAILVAVVGLLFFPDNPWLTIVAIPFVFVGILGWALEDPMAPLSRKLIKAYGRKEVQSPFQIGQEVLDKDGYPIGKVQARFTHYILVERGGLRVKTYYVPLNVARVNSKRNLVLLTMTEHELTSNDFNAIPDDLYDESPEYGKPITSGIAQFARGPLSPAETGHYNYGPNFPGMNTDASGSYHHEEVRPTPQKYVGDRRRLYATDRPIPPRVTNPE